MTSEIDVNLPHGQVHPRWTNMQAWGPLGSNTFHIIAPERLITRQYDWLQSFPFQQFHVLFNSLFKVLFIFPSRYLFAIGLSPIFSLRRNLPPILSCNPQQLDSLKVYRKTTLISRTGFSPSMMPHSKGLGLTRNAENTSSNYNSVRWNLTDLKFELVPLHSQLLGESLLFSFPPLIDMLKFSGYPYLIWGQNMSYVIGTDATSKHGHT